MTKLEGITAAFNATINGKSFYKRISNNTTVYNENGTINVRLHDTYVFEYNTKTGVIIIRTGGWMTTTTRNAINTAFAACGLNYSVSFAKGRLWINGKDITAEYKYKYSFAA